MVFFFAFGFKFQSNYFFFGAGILVTGNKRIPAGLKNNINFFYFFWTLYFNLIILEVYYYLNRPYLYKGSVNFNCSNYIIDFYIALRTFFRGFFARTGRAKTDMLAGEDDISCEFLLFAEGTKWKVLLEDTCHHKGIFLSHVEFHIFIQQIEVIFFDFILLRLFIEYVFQFDRGPKKY